MPPNSGKREPDLQELVVESYNAEEERNRLLSLLENLNNEHRDAIAALLISIKQSTFKRVQYAIELKDLRQKCAFIEAQMEESKNKFKTNALEFNNKKQSGILLFFESDIFFIFIFFIKNRSGTNASKKKLFKFQLLLF